MRGLARSRNGRSDRSDVALYRKNENGIDRCVAHTIDLNHWEILVDFLQIMQGNLMAAITQVKPDVEESGLTGGLLKL
ncbi:hypothetical protein MY3296_001657 [Beauveria thailandica]